MLRSCLLACLILTAAPASADSGTVTDDTSLRLGPGKQFPRLGIIRPGARVDVRGCLSGWSWCQVRIHGEQGWVSGRNLVVFDHDERRVRCEESGIRIYESRGFGRHRDIAGTGWPSPREDRGNFDSDWRGGHWRNHDWPDDQDRPGLFDEDRDYRRWKTRPVPF